MQPYLPTIISTSSLESHAFYIKYFVSYVSISTLCCFLSKMTSITLSQNCNGYFQANASAHCHSTLKSTLTDIAEYWYNSYRREAHTLCPPKPVALCFPSHRVTLGTARLRPFPGTGSSSFFSLTLYDTLNFSYYSL